MLPTSILFLKPNSGTVFNSSILSHFPSNLSGNPQVIPSKYIESLTTYQYHHFCNSCLNSALLSVPSIVSIALHLIYMFLRTILSVVSHVMFIVAQNSSCTASTMVPSNIMPWSSHPCMVPSHVASGSGQCD